MQVRVRTRVGHGRWGAFGVSRYVNVRTVLVFWTPRYPHGLFPLRVVSLHPRGGVLFPKVCADAALNDCHLGRHTAAAVRTRLAG